MTPSMHTSADAIAAIQDVPAPTRVLLPIHHSHKTVVKKKELVARGQVVAENRAKGPFGVGFVHATISGAIEDVTPEYIIIGPAPAPKEGEEPALQESPGPVEGMESLRDEELCRLLLELGVDTGRFRPSRTLVINGLNPEPGVTVSEYLIMREKETLERGLKLLQRAIRPGSIYLVIAEGLEATLHGCHVVKTSDVYPFTIDPLVVLRATDAEHPDNVDVLSAMDLFRVGRVAETQLPLLETIVTVGETVFSVPIGTPVAALLKTAGISVGSEEPGWQLAMGGPMRGNPLYDTNVGIPATCTAITLVREGRFPPVSASPCINCGECVLICPARIQPGMLSKFVEFDMIEETRLRHIAACLECGMCSFVCPATRPMLQYMRLAKETLAAEEDFVATCRLSD